MISTQSRVTQSWLDLAAENRGTDRFQISYAAFRSILRARSLSPDELAGVTPLDPAVARELIDAMLSEGRLRLDDAGERVVGAGGLSLDPARQSLTIGNRTFGTWCSLDAIGIPTGLGIDAMVEGTCDDTGDPVRVEISGGEIVTQSPESVVTSLVPASVAMSVYSHL